MHRLRQGITETPNRLQRMALSRREIVVRKVHYERDPPTIIR
jgi:hypothetical protein